MRTRRTRFKRRSILLCAALVAVAASCGSDSAEPAGAPVAPTGSSTPAQTATVTTGVATEGIEGVVSWGGLSRNHVSGPLTYPMSPPVGGDHYSVWANCGIYDEPVPNEYAVHSLEHGAVWITYRPDLPDGDVEVLKGIARRPFVLLSPFPGLTHKVVISAWERQLALDDVKDPRLEQFVSTYIQGPQTPEPGAPCSGGAGSPSG